MQNYEDFLAMVRLFGDPKATEAAVQKIVAAQKAYEKDLNDARLAQEEASKLRADAAKQYADAAKLNDDASLKVEAAQKVFEKADLARSAAEVSRAENAAEKARLEAIGVELDVRMRGVLEREETVERQSKENEALRADLDRRLALLKGVSA
jgi:hypothetical protein